MGKSSEERRLEAARADARALADTIRESHPREASRQDTAATGLSAEIGSLRGSDPGSNRS